MRAPRDHAREGVGEVVGQARHRVQRTIGLVQPVVIGDVIWEPSPEVIERSRIKRAINELLGSEIIEEKQYVGYRDGG